MCPPASVTPAAELNEYWTDEGVIKSLEQFKSGCNLPSNVLSDVNPYNFSPSNLPANMWYFCFGVEKEAENGFWMATGEACEIFSNSAIIGFRNTLQFYEGRAPRGQKTNWMMQEYTTTKKCSSKPDPRALCRVFLADDDRQVHPGLPIDATNPINSRPSTVSDAKHISGQLSKSELLEKNVDDGTGPSAMARKSPDPPPENSPDMEYDLRGDYLELDDLADPLSRSSSSVDSSCMTMTSEECFDAVALLRELDDDLVDKEKNVSSVKFNLSSSTKSKEVVMHPTTLGSVNIDEENKPPMGQASKVDHPPQNEPGDHRNENTSNGLNTTAPSNTTASSSSSEGTSKEEKKDRVGRTKKRKVMKYLCFLAF